MHVWVGKSGKCRAAKGRAGTVVRRHNKSRRWVRLLWHDFAVYDMGAEGLEVNTNGMLGIAAQSMSCGESGDVREHQARTLHED